MPIAASLPKVRINQSAACVTLAAALWAGAVLLPLLATGITPLARIVATLILFVGAVVATFSLRYMRADQRRRGFFASLALLVASVHAFVLTQNLALFAAAWCASGWLMARLIGHSSQWSEARLSSRRAVLAFGIGDSALLIALGLLGWQAGSLDIAAVITALSAMSATVVTLSALLLLVAAAARSALAPFSGWLLSSMTAPTPVSALMHAGFVNAGGFLLLRFAPVLEAAPVARWAAVALGLAAALHGIGIMTVRPDIKRSLAGSTVSQMGFMIMSCGLGAYAAALWHIVAHGLFKAWLFLGSGSAIGMKPGGTAAKQGPGQPGVALAFAISVVTLGTALVLIEQGAAGAGLVPLLLGIATAGTTMLAGLASAGTMRARIGLIAALASFAAFHGAGLALSRTALGADAAPILPGWLLLSLLAAFLGLWVWQQRALSQRHALPPRLYVHLLNAGTLKGEAQ